MKIKSLLATAAIAAFAITTSPAQDILNKLKKKAEEKVIDKLNGPKSTTTPPSSGNTNTGSSNSTNNNNPSNKGGGGLISTPPDVNQNLTDAETAFKSGGYGEARYAVQQAMLGVELEIGNKILKSLPESISSLKKYAEEDQVTSTGYGWAGLTIHREYNNDDDNNDDSNDNSKEFRVTVANNAAWMSAVNMYLSSGGYAQTTGGQQNWKQTKVKGHRAIIEYSEGSGYKLSVPLGQSSIVIFEGTNFSSEPEMMTASNSIDIDAIKKMLGEN